MLYSGGNALYRLNTYFLLLFPLIFFIRFDARLTPFIRCSFGSFFSTLFYIYVDYPRFVFSSFPALCGHTPHRLFIWCISLFDNYLFEGLFITLGPSLLFLIKF